MTAQIAAIGRCSQRRGRGLGSFGD